MAAGAAASTYSLGIGLAIVALIFVVSSSYAQTIKAYPAGGGSYIVAKENLVTSAGLVSGAALQGHETALCLLALWFTAWVNLCGVKESGTGFASGCTALTGIEAVSNGVQAFKPPESEHAIKTMKWGRSLLFVLFTGITVLAYGFQLLTREGETLLSQLAR